MSRVRSDNKMPRHRMALAAVAGALLYYVAVVWLGGVLAAIAVPKSYFAVFGREHLELALALLGLTIGALPVLLAVFLGAFAVLRACSASRSCAVGLSLGALASFLGWQANAAHFVASQPSSALSLIQAFASVVIPRWWEVPQTAAPWLGLGLAFLVFFRSSSTDRALRKI